jgi:hypothetical protein
VEKIDRGFLRFNLHDWVYTSTLMSQDPSLDLHHTANFYDSNLLKCPEFSKQNFQIQLKDAERQFLIDKMTT